MACRSGHIAPSASLLVLKSSGAFSLAARRSASRDRRAGFGATDRFNLAIRHWNRIRNNQPA
jgi:hypothetical protein